jgi:hypothetical protein
MAQIQNAVALQIAQDAVALSGQLLRALEELQERYDWAVGAGINFNDFETPIGENGNTQHTTPQFLNKLFANVVPGVKGFLDANEVTIDSTQYTYMDVLQTNRRS